MKAHAPVVFGGVWKKFRRGQRHDSLRDLIPATLARALKRGPRPAADTDEFWALRDVSFEVQPGETLGIIGRNGAGKSTILKLLTRILRPTSGKCHLHGRVGALIEIAAGFHPDLTGRENIFLQGAIMGMCRKEVAARFDEIVEFAGVETFLDTPVKRYSSGMSARLGFSIAAHLDPDVLLIDEVLAVGDMRFQQKCHERMEAFRGKGAAVIFVSHHLPAVNQFCNRALLLEAGAVACVGPPSDVVARYCNGSAPDDRCDVIVTATLEAGGRGGSQAPLNVEPGDRVHVHVNLAFRIDVERVTVGVVVWDLARELYVYGARSDQIGFPPIRARRGDLRQLDFSFEANLTRGLYAVEVNVRDQIRQRFLIIARGISHFQVSEHVSCTGVANLYLTAHIREIVHETQAWGERPAGVSRRGAV